MADAPSTTRRRLATKADVRIGMGVFAILIIGAVIGVMQVDFSDDSGTPRTAAQPIDATTRPIDATTSFTGGVSVTNRPEEASHRRAPWGIPLAPKKQAR